MHDLKPGTRIVSHSFDMGDWKPEKMVELGWRKVYFWTVTDETKRLYGEKGSSVDGQWVYTMPTPNGDMDAQLTLKTNGNVLTGTFVFAENRRLEITEGTVDGNKLNFVVKRDRPSGGVMVYKMTGTVEGDQIKGATETSMDGQSMTQEWKAKRK
jgi:hypothetical protein